MNRIENAVKWAIGIADDPSHGYDQANRQGPDYDCSSLVIAAWEHAGVPVRKGGATYTGNMKPAFTGAGFTNVSGKVNFSTGEGLQRGDVLLNEINHTAMYIGNGRIVQAGGNEFGGIVGGQTGDQTGKEIMTMGYYNFPWDCILRYEGPDIDVGPTDVPGEYTVQYGDSLWSIAALLLGDGTRYGEISDLNGLTDDLIKVGQVLKIPQGEPPVAPAPGADPVMLPRLSEGAEGYAVGTMQNLLFTLGYALPSGGADGKFGPETRKALEEFQRENGLTPGPCDGPTWYKLVCG